MKLLQVANVGSITGGTGACALSITKCLPDWEHHVIFASGSDKDGTLKQEFGCEITFESQVYPHHIDSIKPDVIIFHNSPEGRIPNFLRDDILTFYYQHSAVKACRAGRQRCNLFWAVSYHLARTANISDDLVFYQPCPKPVAKSEKNEQFTVGRICTPKPRKWIEDEVVPLYERLAQENPHIHWEFVGCPHDLRDKLKEACQGSANFIPPSWGMRHRIATWDVLLYDAKQHESYGRIVCESQRAGCVPIVSNHSGFVEQIEHGKTGYLCDGIDEFSQALQEVQNEDLRRDIIEKAKIAGDSRGGLKVWRKKFYKWIEAYLQTMT